MSRLRPSRLRSASRLGVGALFVVGLIAFMLWAIGRGGVPG